MNFRQLIKFQLGANDFLANLKKTIYVAISKILRRLMIY